MIPFKIGNWLINNDGIQWDGQPAMDYKISKNTLNDIGGGDRANKYDWLVHLPEKTWLTEMDIYALNTALVYALEYFEVGFSPKISFVKTFIEQQRIIADKEEFK